MLNHALFHQLSNLGLCNKDSLELYNIGVRDNPNIKAYKCSICGAILLDDISSSSPSHYSSQEGYSYFATVADTPTIVTEDDLRRSKDFLPLVKSKKVLDFGCGRGGFAISIRDKASIVNCIELQSEPRKRLNELGISVFETIDQTENDAYDIITLFHVLEHLDNPIGTLNELYKKCKPGGKIIIEVPCAEDPLLNPLNLESFKQFTLWSEHLILHTKRSLQKYLASTKFQVQSVKRYQRYPLSNHLYWILKNRPGGHEKWSFLNRKSINNSYSFLLNKMGRSDTLIAELVKK